MPERLVGMLNTNAAIIMTGEKASDLILDAAERDNRPAAAQAA